MLPSSYMPSIWGTKNCNLLSIEWYLHTGYEADGSNNAEGKIAHQVRFVEFEEMCWKASHLCWKMQNITAERGVICCQLSMIVVRRVPWLFRFNFEVNK
jgi:hypothetical protein